MEKTVSRECTYAVALVELAMDGKCSEIIREAKLEAITRAMRLTNMYLKCGIRADLINLIMKKKTDLILAAGTLADIRKASEPPKPRYNGCSWYEDPLTVPEEEMVSWSQVSLKGPLIECAYKRYMDLFTRTFGMSEEEILFENLGSLP